MLKQNQILKETNPYCLYCGEELHIIDSHYVCSNGSTVSRYLIDTGNNNVFCPICSYPHFIGERILRNGCRLYSFCSNADCPEYNINNTIHTPHNKYRLYRNKRYILDFVIQKDNSIIFNYSLINDSFAKITKETNNKLYLFANNLLYNYYLLPQ